MAKTYPTALALLLTACGGASPFSPSPTPAPAPIPAPAPVKLTIVGTITDTVSHAVIGSFTQDVANLPASVTVSAPGHMTRETRVGSTSPTVDLIPLAAPFSTIFYGQMVRNLLESPTPDVVRTLPVAPSFYLQTNGLSGANVSHLIAAARDIVPAMTGGRFVVTTFDTGSDARQPSAGWIVIELVSEPDSGKCGLALVGASAGHIWLNTAKPAANGTCGTGGDLIAPQVIQHEIGHALGFFHIDVPYSLMNGARWAGGTSLLDSERYHAAIAYSRQSGNRDPDIDAPTAAPLSTRGSLMVVD